tara:strand:- start:779 stop:934 length:156 start_codon:yes stop_codon:yes gene_type:complete
VKKNESNILNIERKIYIDVRITNLFANKNLIVSIFPNFISVNKQLKNFKQC